jgi:outer membrane cobalamin receptor
LTSQYNLRDKILAGASVYYLSGQYAKLINGSQFSEVTLDGLVDVNLNFEYRYTKFLSLYANFNNIAAQRYQRWYGYPTQRFNFVAGLSYTF